MVEPEGFTPEQPIEDTAEVDALADNAPVETEASEPVICDPVIGFVCPRHAMAKAL